MKKEIIERHEDATEDVAGHLWLNPWAPSYHNRLLLHLGQGGVIFSPRPTLPLGRQPEPAGPLFSAHRQ